MLTADDLTHPLTKALVSSLLKLDLNQAVINKQGRWCFTETLQNLPDGQFTKAILSHNNLKVMHDALSSEYVANVDGFSEKNKRQRLVALLTHAELLVHLYRKFLPEAQKELQELENKQLLYKTYLSKQGVESTTPNWLDSMQPIKAGFTEQSLRNLTKDVDFWRLLFVRTRRMILFSVGILNEAYGQWVLWLDNVLRIIAMYQAILLVPRFITNITSLFNYYKQTPREREDVSPTATALAKLDMQNRWWELAYDFGWITCGILAALVLTGSLGYAAIYLTVINPVFNMVINVSRLVTEFSRFNEMIHIANQDLNAAIQADDKEQINALKAYIVELKHKRDAQVKPLFLNVGVSLFIVSTAFVMMFCVMNPWTAFIAALIAVVATIVGKLIGQFFVTKPKLITEATLGLDPKVSDDDASLKESDDDEEIDDELLHQDSSIQTNIAQNRSVKLPPLSPFQNILSQSFPHIESSNTVATSLSPKFFEKGQGTNSLQLKKPIAQRHDVIRNQTSDDSAIAHSSDGSSLNEDNKTVRPNSN